MQLDPVLPVIVGVTLIVFLLSFALRLMKQPHVIGYIIAGVLIGPFGLKLIQEGEIVAYLGDLGVMLLLFFIGMQVSIHHLIKKWRVAVIGTLTQLIITVLIMVFLGAWLDWPLPMRVLLGFVISLSSTAVVMDVLEEWGEVNTRVGQNVLSILLVQDVLIIPMIVILDFMGKGSLETGEVFLTLIGGVLMLFLLVWVLRRKEVKLPFAKHLPKDKETQVIISLVLCFGLAVVSSMFGLSAALGAFIAGVLVSSMKQTRWARSALEPFHVVFVAIFFIYVGLLIDVPFLMENAVIIISLVLLVLILNTTLNAGILLWLGDHWKGAVYGGALLSEIGEFSFLIGIVGYQAGLITPHAYQFIVSIIALTLFLSPFWVEFFKKIVGVHGKHVPV